MASLSSVPCWRYGVAGCGVLRTSSRSVRIMLRRSADDVVGIGQCLGKNLMVLLVRIGLVAGM